MVVLRLPLANSDFLVLCLFTIHLAATMITNTEFLDLRSRAIRCMESAVKETRGIVRILGQDGPAVEATEAYVDTPKQTNGTRMDPTKVALLHNAIRATKTIIFPHLTQLSVLVRFQFPS